MNEEREKFEKEGKTERKETEEGGGREILIVNDHPQLFRPSQEVKNRFTI